MLIRFFFDLRKAGVPVSITELLSLLAALQARVSFCSAEEFYYLARLALVKDERFFDRFDRAFAEHFAGAEKLFERIVAELPADWLKLMAQRVLSEEERAKIEALGRSAGSALRLHDLLKAQPLLSVATATARLNLSHPTIGATITRLVDLGILRETTGRQRGRVFAYGRYIDILSRGTEPLPR